MGIITTIKEIERLREIVDVLFEQEFGYLIDMLELRTHLLFRKRIDRKRFLKHPELSTVPGRLRVSMEKLGGAFVKLGQLLSLRPDLIPKEYVEEFSKLQDKVEEFSYEEAVNVVETEYNKKLNEVFLKFEKIPVASASVSQVHKAWLKNGKKVAVKIQRPGIEEKFNRDIILLKHLADIIENHYPELKVLNPRKIIDEFERYTKRELDFNMEARNIESFYNKFKSDKRITIPRVYREYTTKRIVVMDFIEGDKVSEIKDDLKFKNAKKDLVETVINSFMKQVLVYNLFHADLHPGNILLLNRNRIALLDFGIIGHISFDSKEKVENLFIALTTGNRAMLASSMIELGFVDEDINLEEFKDDLSEHLGPYYDAELKDLRISEVLYDLLELANKHNIRFPNSFILLVKAIITTEGFSKEFYPDYNYLNSWKLYARKILRKRKRPYYLVQYLKSNASGIRKFLFSFPENFNKLVSAKSNHKVSINPEDIKTIEKGFNRTFIKISYGIIISALIISAAILYTKEARYYVFGVPLISVIFLISAFILFLILINSRNVEKGG